MQTQKLCLALYGAISTELCRGEISDFVTLDFTRITHPTMKIAIARALI